MMSELIYKQDAIDAIMSEPPDAHYPTWYADILWKLPSEDYEDIWKKGYDVGYSMGKEDGRADALQEVFDKFAVEVRKI